MEISQLLSQGFEQVGRLSNVGGNHATVRSVRFYSNILSISRRVVEECSFVAGERVSILRNGRQVAIVADPQGSYAMRDMNTKTQGHLVTSCTRLIRDLAGGNEKAKMDAEITHTEPRVLIVEVGEPQQQTETV